MLKCTKDCFSKKNFKRNIISFLKLYPVMWVFIKSIYGNTVVQVVLLISLGIWLLRYGEINNSQTLQTVAITLITASIFKFLLSANAFVTMISKVVRESFVDMEFLQHFKDDKIITTTKTLVDEICDRKYSLINEKLSNHIMNILDSSNGYYSSVSIEIEDSIIEDKIHTKCTYKLSSFNEQKENMPNGYVFDNTEHDFEIENITLNSNDMTQKIKSNYSFDSKKEFTYYIEIPEGENELKITEHYTDKDKHHAIFFNKISSNVKVKYKHCSNIINPKIQTRFGEYKESHSKDGELFIHFGENIFVENEFIYISFDIK